MGYKALIIFYLIISVLISVESSGIEIASKHYENTVRQESIQKLIIYEFHPYSYPSKSNEYICILNPSTEDINLDNHLISDGEGIIYLRGTIRRGCKFYIAESAENFTKVMGFPPNITYENSSRKFSLGNSGDNILLIYNNSVLDAVYYGECDVDSALWKGEPLPKPTPGTVYRRKGPIDSDSANDWISRKIYIGQSDFKPRTFTVNCEIVLLVLPDAGLDLILEELKNSNKSIIIQSYRLDSEIVALCLANISNKVKVEIMIEGNPAGGLNSREVSILKYLREAGCHIRAMYNNYSRKIYDRYRYIKSSYIVIDNSTAIILSGPLTNYVIPTKWEPTSRTFCVIIRNEDVAKYLANVFYDDFSVLKEDSVDFTVIANSTSITRVKTGKMLTVRKSSITPILIRGYLNITPIVSPDFSLDILKEFLSSSNTVYGEIRILRKDLFYKIFPNKLEGKIILHNDTENTEIINHIIKRGIKAKIFRNHAHRLSGISGTAIANSRSIFIGTHELSEYSINENREIGVLIESDVAAEYLKKIVEHDWKDDVTPPILKIESRFRDGIYYFYARCVDDSQTYYRWYLDGRLVSTKAWLNTSLSPGDHTITLLAEDIHGNSNSVTLKISVPIQISPNHILLMMVFLFYSYYLFNVVRKRKR